MTIDLKSMLDRVVAEVFDENFAVEDATAADDALRPAVLVRSRLVQGRTAIIRASHTWLDGFIPELNVQTGIFDDDDDDDVEPEKEDELGRICVVMRAYLRGEGRIKHRRRWFRRGTVPVLYIEIDGGTWRLGRNLWAVGEAR